MYIISPCQVDVTMFNVQYPTTLLVTTNEPRTIPVLAKVHGPLELLNKGATNGYHMYVYIYIYIYIYIYTYIYRELRTKLLSTRNGHGQSGLVPSWL